MSSLNKEQLDYFDEFGFLPLEKVFDPVRVYGNTPNPTKL